MKKRGKRYGLWVLCLCLICLCTACGKESEGTGQSNSQEITETEGQSVKETTLPKEAPEGYVYDYQVSMEPIPKEIADLGGPCVGTMHAFPTRIEMALTQQEVEKDPELKAEVEKCTQEVKDALTEEVGGEFEVQVMSMKEEYSYWKFFCAEVSTGYEFSIGYENYKRDDPETTLDNDIFVMEYYDTKVEQSKNDHEKKIYDMMCEIFPNGIYDVEYMKIENQTSIFLAQFPEKDFSKEKEQEKILKLWEKLKQYDAQVIYALYIGYYPEEYKEMLKQRCQNGIFWDIYTGYQKDELKVLIDNQEIYDYFSYYEDSDDENNISLDTFLVNYRQGTYKKNQTWDYWIGEN